MQFIKLLFDGGAFALRGVNAHYKNVHIFAVWVVAQNLRREIESLRPIFFLKREFRHTLQNPRVLLPVKSAQFFRPILVNARHKIAAIKPVRRLDVFPDVLTVFFTMRSFGFGDKTSELFRINRVSQFGVELIRAVTIQQKILLDCLTAVQSFANV
jgi:hypothetical protein